jgi:hypothetical protein
VLPNESFVFWLVCGSAISLKPCQEAGSETVQRNERSLARCSSNRSTALDTVAPLNSERILLRADAVITLPIATASTHRSGTQSRPCRGRQCLKPARTLMPLVTSASAIPFMRRGFQTHVESSGPAS